MVTSHISRTLARIALALTLVAAGATTAFAQRGGGGGGGGGGSDAPMTLELGRFETLKQSFQLDKDQANKIKSLLDEAHKSAQPARDGLTKSRAAISAAIQGGKGQADIDAAVKEYATHVAAMTSVEVKALAHLMQALTPEQRAKTAAVQNAFFMFRGIFLDNKKWDILADGFYGY